LFDGLNALFVLAISLLTALLATVIPVRSLVKKKPVEAIRAL
jgi:ABC-type lipoprotein release transport system permease subunit